MQTVVYLGKVRNGLFLLVSRDPSPFPPFLQYFKTYGCATLTRVDKTQLLRPIVPIVPITGSSKGEPESVVA